MRHMAPAGGQVQITSQNTGSKGFAIYNSCDGAEIYCEDFNSASEVIRDLILGEHYIFTILS